MRSRITPLAVAAGLLLTTACTSESTSDVSIPATLPSQPPGDESANRGDAKRFTDAAAADGTPLALKVTHIIEAVDGDRPYTYLVTTAEDTPSTQDVSALIEDWFAWPDKGTEPAMVGVYKADGTRIGSASIDPAAKA
ncbi:hypothetical protein ABZX62_01015 [Streptomyces flavidovirens]|uniref:hypothetical protein n=1 Tax=Streptomyces flavidovirens TaxID=67298 RepID=UPI0033A292E2